MGGIVSGTRKKAAVEKEYIGGQLNFPAVKKGHVARRTEKNQSGGMIE
jgi:hypothetical protein